MISIIEYSLIALLFDYVTNHFHYGRSIDHVTECLESKKNICPSSAIDIMNTTLSSFKSECFNQGKIHTDARI